MVSQKKFLHITNFVLKKISSLKFFLEENFVCTKIVDPKNFGPQKILSLKKILVQKSWLKLDQ